MTADPGVRDRVLGEITSLLAGSQAYRDLPDGQRSQLLADMTKVGSYLADRGWIHDPPAVATGLEDKPISASDLHKLNAAKDPGLVQDQFRASAVREGVDAFRDMVKAVDFPKFVASLVQGVFRAIVDASIQQMQAFSELLSAAGKTADQFAGDNISDGMARDFIANQNPTALRVDTSGGSARLRPSGEDGGAGIGKNFGIDDVDFDDDESEGQLVLAAKQQMARSKQQMLATMVLMGINRIVVTNGNINAKVVFDMRASDDAKRRRKAQMADKEKDHAASQTGWFTNLVGGYDVSHDHETTVSSSLDETSESKAAMKAQLTGDVRLAFKSETFPLERMVDLIGMQNLQQKAQPVATPGRAPAPAPAPVPAPAPNPGVTR